MDFIFWLSLIVFLLVVSMSLEIAIGANKIGQLADVPEQTYSDMPRVSIIVAALNEAETIEPALQSLLALDYPNFECIVINDRSTDATPAILDKLAQHNTNLKVLHLDELPTGWLGKNHALYRGAEHATGEYLLFTDADVVFDRSALARAVNYCQTRHVDHLTLLFDVVAKTALLGMLVLSFSVNFMARFKPWKVGSSDRHFLGAGGFNLVRRQVYLQTGGHGAIPMAVIDDMMLGKLLKKQGYRQHVLYGRGLVGVEWYRSAGDMFKGLKKNIFAAFDYRLSQLVGVTVLMLIFRVWPWVGIFVASGPARWLNIATVLSGLLLYIYLIRSSNLQYRCLAYAPVISLVELAIWWNGSLSALVHNSIDWRGTRYRLSELKKGNKV